MKNVFEWLSWKDLPQTYPLILKIRVDDQLDSVADVGLDFSALRTGEMLVIGIILFPSRSQVSWLIFSKVKSAMKPDWSLTPGYHCGFFSWSIWEIRQCIICGPNSGCRTLSICIWFSYTNQWEGKYIQVTVHRGDLMWFWWGHMGTHF